MQSRSDALACLPLSYLLTQTYEQVMHPQVYRGRLRSTGEEVALKVQRPGIGEQICIDMVLLRRLMLAVDSTLPKLKLPLQVSKMHTSDSARASQLQSTADCGRGLTDAA